MIESEVKTAKDETLKLINNALKTFDDYNISLEQIKKSKGGKKILAYKVIGDFSSRDKEIRKEITDGIYDYLKQFVSVYKKKNDLSETVDTIVIPIEDEKYKEIKIVVKGKTGGSGLGAELTTLAEQYHAELLNFAWKNQRKITKDDVKLPKGLGKGWDETFVNVTNLIFDKYFKKNKNLTFYHSNDKKIKQLFDIFKKLNKEENYNLMRDKWCPADIWGIDKNLTLSFNVKTLLELKKETLKLFNENKFLPISLKKAPKNPKISIYNIKDKLHLFDKIPYFYFTNNDLLKSKDIYLGIENNVIQFRTFNIIGSWEGEIKGKYANHGKIGGGVVWKIVSDIVKNKSGIVFYNQISKDLTKKRIDNLKEEQLEKIIKRYKNELTVILRKLHLKYNKQELEKFLNRKDEKIIDWLKSKLIGLKLWETLNNPQNLKIFFDKCFLYASSETEVSLPFIKIQ